MLRQNIFLFLRIYLHMSENFVQGTQNLRGYIGSDALYGTSVPSHRPLWKSLAQTIQLELLQSWGQYALKACFAVLFFLTVWAYICLPYI